MFFNDMELGQITLEGVLIIVIALITLNLIFIGFYILSVLRELRKTLTRARSMMEEVDRSVKTGMDKFIAIERPLEALSTTTNALAGFIKGAGMIKKTTQSILNSNDSEEVKTEVVVDNSDNGMDVNIDIKSQIEEDVAVIEEKPKTESKKEEKQSEKKIRKRPKFFRS